MKDINDSTNEACSTLPDMTDTMYVETLDLFPTYHGIRKISDQIDKLTIDLNTQHPQVEIERVKRQKMRLIMRQLRNKKTPADPIVDQLRQKVVLLTRKVESITEAYNGEIARVSTATYLCFSILHQILITIVPYLSMPPSNHVETSQLIYELLRAINHLGPIMNEALNRINSLNNVVIVNICIIYCNFPIIIYMQLS